MAPAAVDSRTQGCQRVVDIIYGALAEAIPGRVTAAHNGANTAVHLVGVKPGGEIFTYLETLGGGFGARATKDGLDGVQVPCDQYIEPANRSPGTGVSPDDRALRTGPRFRWARPLQRAAMGLLREIKILASDVEFGYSSTRIESAPWGLFGGLAGGRGSLAVKRAETGPPPERPTQLRTGDSLIITTAGAGGYQDPKTRDRDLVSRDLAEGKISERTAREIYGVNK